MDPRQNNAWSGKVNIAAAGESATLITMTAGQKWVLDCFTFGWCSMVDSTTMSLYEIDATNSSVYFSTMLSATSGFGSLYFGGALASATNTRLVVNTGATLSLWGVGTGWTLGG